MTDNLTLFAVQTKSLATAKKKCLTNLQTLNKFHEINKLNQLAYTRSEYKGSNLLVKEKSHLVLSDTLPVKTLDHIEEQYLLQNRDK